MIEITPEIIGPGIDEEYVDAQAVIDDLRNERMAERGRIIRYAGSRGHLPRV